MLKLTQTCKVPSAPYKGRYLSCNQSQGREVEGQGGDLEFKMFKSANRLKIPWMLTTISNIAIPSHV